MRLSGSGSAGSGRPSQSQEEDETKLKLKEEQLYVWAAVDVKAREVLAYHVSWVRNSLHAEWFFRRP